MNIVHLTGRVGGDPEIRTLNNGDRVANLSLATEERWKDRETGEKRSRTTWHPVVVFVPGTVKFLEGYVKKGDLIQVTGMIRVEEWTDQADQKRRTTKIGISNPNHRLEKLASRPDAKPGPAEAGSEAPAGTAPDQDDDIPF